MNDEMRKKEVIEMLLLIYDNIRDAQCVDDKMTVIKGCKPDSLKFVIKEAILALT